MDTTTTDTITKEKPADSLQNKILPKAYIYPISKRHKTGIHNPYIDNFIQYGGANYKFVNKHDPSASGLFHVLKYINDIDILYLNWIEKLPDLKGGIFQIGLLLIIIRYCKIKGVKIVWTMHNNVAHSNKHFRLKKFIFNKMIHKSDLIITHSKEGQNIVKEQLRHARKVFYFPHPVLDNMSFESFATVRQEYDILIWGSIVPYKGIHLFLEYLKEHHLLQKYHIRIIGRCSDHEYLKKISAFNNQFIQIQNRIPGDNELRTEMRKSRIVLFTYNSDSVLSSGALAESISNGALVIGPEKGAFRDLAELNYILCYSSFDSLIGMIDKALDGKDVIPRYVFSKFLREFHWSEFSEKLHKKLNPELNAQFIL